MHETFNLVVEWINRAGTAHWNFAAPMFVQTAVLVGGLCVLEVCLRRRVRPVVRYWIWALVALKLLLPVTLSTPASLAYWLVPASHGESTPAAPIMSAPRFDGTDIGAVGAAGAVTFGQMCFHMMRNGLAPMTCAAVMNQSL